MSPHPFRVVNRFLQTELDARGIRTAMELGVIDFLARGDSFSLEEISRLRSVNPRGLKILMDMLLGNQVVEEIDNRISLSRDFRGALQFADLLESRMAFADLIWPDIHQYFTQLLNNIPEFMAKANVFKLFRYDRCFEISPQNIAATAAWVKFTTCLTKYEAASVIQNVDLTSVANLVDLGGNSGEFVLRICREYPGIAATVVDLPVVCHLGRQHIDATASRGEADRITFIPADLRNHALPPPVDLVTFKSVLHDWPDADARTFMDRARESVRPGGRLLIFEREPIDLRGSRIPYSMAPDLVFLHFLRPAEFYLDHLAKLGFESIEYRRIVLDIGFHLIVATRPM